MIFETRVNGIPCLCEVTHYLPGSPLQITGSGMGDAEPPIHPEFEFRLLDLRQRPAHWLYRYVTPAVEDRLWEEFQMERRAEEYAL